MTVEKLIKSMHRKYAGDSRYPAAGTADYIRYLDTANELKDTCATDENNKWDWAFEDDIEIGEASSALTYNLPANVHDLSDYVYVVVSSGKRVPFKIIKKKDRGDKLYCVYISSKNPKKITFTNMPTNCIGHSIVAGAYVIPPDMVNPSDLVPIGRPEWLAFAGAAMLAFNDPSKEDKFPDLNGMANAQYQEMEMANNLLPDHQEDSIPTEGYSNNFDDHVGY